MFWENWWYFYPGGCGKEYSFSVFLCNQLLYIVYLLYHIHYYTESSLWSYLSINKLVTWNCLERTKGPKSEVTGTGMKPWTSQLKVNYMKTRKTCEMCSKLTIKTPERYWRRSGVFIINFEHISQLFLVFLSLTLNKQISAGNHIAKLVWLNDCVYVYKLVGCE